MHVQLEIFRKESMFEVVKTLAEEVSFPRRVQTKIKELFSSKQTLFDWAK